MSSGFNVYPNEVEAIATACPGVMECACIGVPDQKTGEAVKLFVVRMPNATLTAEELGNGGHTTGPNRRRGGRAPCDPSIALQVALFRGEPEVELAIAVKQDACFLIVDCANHVH